MRAKRHRLAVAVFLVVLPACLEGRAGVGLKPLTADIVFGIPPPQQPVTAPDTIIRPGPVSVTGDDFGDIPIPLGPAAKPCNAARFNEVQKSADVALEGLPKEGLYRWKNRGDYNWGPPLGRLPIVEFGDRTIVDVRKLATSPQDFAYTLKQRETLGNTRYESTFEVITSRPNPPTIQNQKYYETTSQNSLNGIYLTRFVVIEEGGARSEATYNPPVMYLPLPVPTGVTFSTTTSDPNPNSLSSFTHTGKVIERRRYDACGELVEGWFIDGSQTYSFRDDEPVTRNYDYTIATQYGGILIFEHIETPCENYDTAKNTCGSIGDFRLDTHIGQLEPDPLPR